MKKSTKVLLGIATIWPIVYIFLFIAVIFSALILLPHNPGPPALGSEPPGSVLFPVGFAGLMVVHMFTILGSLALTVFYIIRIFKTDQLDQNMKIMWTLLLFFVGMLAQPVFWYLYIWREPTAVSGKDERQLVGSGFQSQWPGQTTQTTAEREAANTSPPLPPDWR